jgi:serine/threonine protein kinase
LSGPLYDDVKGWLHSAGKIAMTARRWQQVKAIFEGIAECDPAARLDLIRERCGDDEELRREVEAMLGSDASSGSPPDNPIPEEETVTSTALVMESVYSEAVSHRYELLGLMGKGGMGVVYKARDRETDEIVALKFLKLEIAADSVAMERFKNELRLARRITHPAVARIYEFNRNGAVAYISMEFVDGETLRDFLKRRGKLDLNEFLDIARQICDGLNAAHQRKIVHRDLKPGNVMLDRSNNIKIMDFGIARSFADEEATITAAVAGTPKYMAPEQASGKQSDHRTDIYALGLILHEMITGHHPFLRADEHRQASDPDPVLPLSLRQVIGQCLQVNPEQRIQSVEELRNALSQPPTQQVPWLFAPSVPRRFLLYAALFTGALLILGVVGMMGVRGKSWKSGPFSSAVPQAQQSRPQPQPPLARSSASDKLLIAALPFTNLAQAVPATSAAQMIADAFRSTIRDSLVNALGRDGRFRMVERSKVDKAIEELNLNPSDLTDISKAQRVGKLVGTPYLIGGSFRLFEGRLRVTSRIIRVEPGDILFDQTFTRVIQDGNGLALPDPATEQLLDEASRQFLRDSTVAFRTSIVGSEILKKQ